MIISLLSLQRMTIPEIIESEWFQKDYVPTCCSNECDEKINLDDVNAAFNSIEVIMLTILATYRW